MTTGKQQTKKMGSMVLFLVEVGSSWWKRRPWTVA
jgi:hypothetical protein